jgi:hypothetical protein
MSAHNPIGSCCTRPRFNAVGGVDDFALKCEWNARRLVDHVRKLDRTTVFAVAGILAALAVVYVCALILL